MLWLETTISRDEGAFGFIGSMWTNGILPTYWLDTQGPITYAIYAAITYLFGNSIIPIRLLNNLLFLLSYTIIYLISSKLFGKRIGILSALFFGFSMNVPILEAMTALTEPISIPFTVLSVYLMIKSVDNNCRLKFISSGILMAISTLIRATNGVGFLLLFFILIRNQKRPLNKNSFITSILFIIFGAAIPVLAVFTYFGLFNDLNGLIQLYFRAGLHFTNLQDVPIFIKYLITIENLPVWLFSIVGIVVSIKERSENNIQLLVWAFLFSSISVIPPTFGHRVILLLPSVSILAGLGLNFTYERINEKMYHKQIYIKAKKFKYAYFFIIILIGSILIPSVFYQSKQYPNMNFSYEGMEWAYADSEYNTQIEVSKYLVNNTSPKSIIFVHGWAAEIYWMSEKLPPSKFVWSLLSLPEEEENRLIELTKETGFDYVVVFSSNKKDIFDRAESYDPITKYFLLYYFYDKNIDNAHIFNKYNNANERVIYNFIEDFQKANKYYGLTDDNFGNTEELEEVFSPKIKLIDINGDIRYSIQQTPLDQLQYNETVNSYISYDVNIPSKSNLNFGITFDPKFWTTAHETRFQIHIENKTDKYEIFDFTLNPKEIAPKWFEYSLNLSEFENQNVKIIYSITTGSEKINSDSFAAWGNPVIVTNGQEK